MEARFGGGGGGGDDDEDDEDEDDEDDEEEEWGQPRRSPKRYYDEVTVAQDAGINLERGGEFGSVSWVGASQDRRRADWIGFGAASKEVRSGSAQVCRPLVEPRSGVPHARVRLSQDSQVLHWRCAL